MLLQLQRVQKANLSFGSAKKKTTSLFISKNTALDLYTCNKCLSDHSTVITSHLPSYCVTACFTRCFFNMYAPELSSSCLNVLPWSSIPAIVANPGFRPTWFFKEEQYPGKTQFHYTFFMNFASSNAGFQLNPFHIKCGIKSAKFVALSTVCVDENE